MNSITIKKPCVFEHDNKTSLQALVIFNIDNKIVNKTIFYEVDKEWGSYLTYELSDPFVLALVDFAMEKNAYIKYEAPMTEDLRYQLERYLIPVYSRKLEPMHNIKIEGPVTTWKPLSKGVTGTGFSGGVDSFYTVLSHLDNVPASKKITHLLLCVNGAANTGYSEALDKKWLADEETRFEPVAKKLGLKLISVNSNVSLLDNYRKYFLGGGTVRTCSFVHALRKLFGTYYWASAYEADVINFNLEDPGYIEPFNVPLMSVDGLRFYHSGCEVSRIEKVEFIADNSLVEENLTVCGQPKSCGHCYKCLRTMAELNSFGKIDHYGKVFDLNDFHKHYTSKLAREFASDHKEYVVNIKKNMHEHNINIPLIVELKSVFIFKPYYFFKNLLKSNRLLMDLYYKKGWSEKQ